MENKNTTNDSAALGIGRGIVSRSKNFLSGLKVAAKSTGSKFKNNLRSINRSRKVVVAENDKQRRIEDNIKEQVARKTREQQSESKGANQKGINNVRAAIQKPLNGLLALLAAWLVDNGKKVAKIIRVTWKKITAYRKLITRSVNSVGTIISSIGKIIVAAADNIRNFDFADNSGKLKAATDQLDGGYKALENSLTNIGEVWGMEESELDALIKSIDSGENYSRANTPAFGAGSRGGGGTTDGYVPASSIPDKVKSDTGFQKAVTGSAKRLGVSEDYLYAVMNFETGGSFDPAQRNMAGSGATGLIQFMPATARGMGTSTDALSKMNRVQQMKYVEQYLKDAGVKSGASLSDLYMSVLFPAAVGKGEDFVLFGKGAMSGFTGRAYDQNKGLDKDSSGSITKAEASQKVLSKLPASAMSSGVSGGSTEGMTPPQPATSNAPVAMDNVLTSKQFDSMDSSSSSPILKTSVRGMRGGKHHGGVDFGTGGQRGWYCAYRSNGKVTFVGTLSGYGKTVIIQFGNVDLVFAHLANYGPGISQGANYSAGQTIGEVGSTGRSSGIHLHFEARPVGGMGGSDIDVNPYIPNLVFGKRPKTKKAGSLISSNASQKSEAIAQALQSKRTGAGTTKTDVIAITKETIIAT